MPNLRVILSFGSNSALNPALIENYGYNARFSPKDEVALQRPRVGVPASGGMSSSVTSSSGGVGGGGGGWGLDFYDCVINNDLERLESLVERHKIDLDAKFTEVRKKNHLDLSPIHLVAYKVRVDFGLAESGGR